MKYISLITLLYFILFQSCVISEDLNQNPQIITITNTVTNTVIDTLEIIVYDDTFTVQELESVPLYKKITTPLFAHYKTFYQTPNISGYWGGHWTWPNSNPEIIIDNQRRQVSSNYYPIIGLYDSSDPFYLEYTMLTMKLAGFDGLIIGYYGNTDYLDYKTLLDNTDLTIEWAKKVGLKYPFLYETYVSEVIAENFGRNKKNVLKEHFIYMKENYFTDVDYFKIDGKPILMVFNPFVLSSNQDWQDVFSEINNQLNFITFSETSKNFNSDNFISGIFTWDDPKDELYEFGKKYKYTIGSFDFERHHFENDERVFFSELGAKEEFQNALDHNVDLIQAVTWNFWREGNSIEPTLEYEFHQLVTVKEMLGLERNVENLILPLELFKKRQENIGNELNNKKLDQVFYYIISLQLEKANELLSSID